MRTYMNNISKTALRATSWAFYRLIWVKLASYHIHRTVKVFTATHQNKSLVKLRRHCGRNILILFISSGESRPVHLQLHHPERRSPTGLCPGSPALLSLHTRLCVLSQLHFYHQIRWWYCGSGPHLQQWWDRILGWGRETYIMVPGQLSLSERE